MFSKTAIAAILFIPFFFACSEGDGEKKGSSSSRPLSMAPVTFIVASEFDSYEKVENEQLPVIAAYPEVAICLAIRAEQSQSPELESLLRTAASLGIPIIAWMLLVEDDGYWFSEENLSLARTHVFEFVDWIEENDIPLEWLMFDMEMSLEKTRLLEQGDLVGVTIPMLRDNIDMEAYNQATEDYAQLVRDLQNRGYVVTAAAYPFILDDLLDGDREIQDAFNTPIEDVPFDEIYFMAYRTSFETLLGVQPGPYLVYEYGLEAKQSFGSRGIIGLGTIGRVGMISEQGFQKPSELAEDIAAVRVGGNERVFIFSLDGMASLGPLESWLDLHGTKPSIPEKDDVTGTVRETLAWLDNIFD